MFDLDSLDLASLIKTIDESGLTEFSLTTPDGEIRVSKLPAGGVAVSSIPVAAPAPAAPVAAPVAPAAAAVVPPAVPGPPAPVTSATTSGSAAQAAPEAPDGEQIRTPMLGIFYRAPEPGAAPFVEVGGRVEVETTVAIIEAMKVFTAVQAGVAGTVRAVLVEDRDFVEHDQALFVVEPDEPAA